MASIILIKTLGFVPCSQDDVGVVDNALLAFRGGGILTFEEDRAIDRGDAPGTKEGVLQLRWIL